MSTFYSSQIKTDAIINTEAFLGKFLAVMALFGVLVPAYSDIYQPLQAEPGVFDLRKVDFSSTPLVDLDGQWHYEPRAFLTEKDLHERMLSSTKKLGRGWDFTGGATSFYGVTYHVRLLVPESGGLWGIYLPDMMSAYRLYAGGVLIAQVGSPSLDSLAHKDLIHPVTAFFPSAAGVVELVIHNSNYSMASGGFRGKVLFGPKDEISRYAGGRIAKNLLSVGILFIAGVLFLLMALSQPKENTYLWFSLLSLTAALRESLMDQRILVRAMSLPFSLESDLEYATVLLLVMFLVLFVRSVVKEFLPRPIVWTSLVANGIFLIPIPFLSILNYAEGPFRAYIFILVPTLAALGVSLSWAAFRGQTGGRIVLAGFTFLALTGLSDYGNSMGWIKIGFNLGLAFMVLVVIQAFWLSYRLSKDLHLIENTSLYIKNMDDRRDVLLRRTLSSFAPALRRIKSLLDPYPLGSGQMQELLGTSFQRLDDLAVSLVEYTTTKSQAPGTYFNFSLAQVLENAATPRLGILELGGAEDPEITVSGDPLRVKKALGIILDWACVAATGSKVMMEAFRGGTQPGLVIHIRGFRLGDVDPHGLFEPFSLTGEYPGGLGSAALNLSLAKQLILMSGWTVSAMASETGVSLHIQAKPETPGLLDWNPGHDTKVMGITGAGVLAPLKRSLEPVTGAMLPDGKTILVVDDEPVNLILMLNMLGRMGFGAYPVSSAYAALERIRQGGVGLVLLDVMMPGMTGHDLLAILRQDYPRETIDVVLVSARGSRTDQLEGLSRGADSYMVKPFGLTQLEAEIRSTLARKQVLIRENPDIVNFTLVLWIPQGAGTQNLSGFFTRNLVKSEGHHQVFRIEANPNAVILNINALITYMNAVNGPGRWGLGLMKNKDRNLKHKKALELAQVREECLMDSDTAAVFQSLPEVYLEPHTRLPHTFRFSKVVCP